MALTHCECEMAEVSIDKNVVSRRVARRSWPAAACSEKSEVQSSKFEDLRPIQLRRLLTFDF
jgi:hypothetical protein